MHYILHEELQGRSGYPPKIKDRNSNCLTWSLYGIYMWGKILSLWLVLILYTIFSRNPNYLPTLGSNFEVIFLEILLLFCADLAWVSFLASLCSPTPQKDRTSMQDHSPWISAWSSLLVVMRRQKKGGVNSQHTPPTTWDMQNPFTIPVIHVPTD